MSSKVFLLNRYFIEGTVNPKCWHLFDNAMLNTFVGSRLGSGSQKDSLGSSCESPNKRPTRRRVVSDRGVTPE